MNLRLFPAQWQRVVCGMAAGLCIAGTAGAAEWRFSPSSRLSPGYTTNPRLLPAGGKDVYVNVAEAAALASLSTERATLSLSPRATFSQYQGDDSLDSNDQYLGISSSWKSERTLWAGAAQLSRDSTQISELGTTGIVASNRRREFISINAGPRWQLSESGAAGVNAQWQDSRYVDAAASGLVDYSYGAATVYSETQFSERGVVRLGARAGVLTTPARVRDSKDADLTLGFDYELGPRWRSSLSVGPSWADSGYEQDRGYLFSADVSRRGETVQLKAGVSHKLNPTGRGLLTEANAFELSASRELSERVATGMTGRYLRNADIFNLSAATGQQVRFYEVDGWLSWRITQTWTAVLSLGGRTQDVVTAGEASRSSADSYRMSFSLSWNGRTVTR